MLEIEPATASLALPIHNLHATMMESRRKRHTTNHCVPILNSDVDPYKSCFIAPHHILSGHAQDCKLLPSEEFREACEFVMIGLLRDSELPAEPVF